MARVVKMNLKKFAEEMLFAHTSNDQQEIKYLENEFKQFYEKQNESIRSTSLRYLFRYSPVKENTQLVNFFNSFVV